MAGETSRVVVGVHDSERVIATVPPLSDDERDTLEWVAVIEPGQAKEVEGADPAYTLIAFEGDSSDAMSRAQRLAVSLGRLRDDRDLEFSTPLQVYLPTPGTNPFAQTA